MIFRKKTVDFPAWNYSVTVVVTSDINAAAKKLHLIAVDEPPPADKSTGGLSRHGRDCGESYLFVKPGSSINAVAHESWHCVRRMLLYAGAELDSETVAYHLGYLAQKVHVFVHQRRK
jgi:hypothetical protein